MPAGPTRPQQLGLLLLLSVLALVTWTQAWL
jgi:hypothetical protein